MNIRVFNEEITVIEKKIQAYGTRMNGLESSLAEEKKELTSLQKRHLFKLLVFCFRNVLSLRNVFMEHSYKLLELDRFRNWRVSTCRNFERMNECRQSVVHISR